MGMNVGNGGSGYQSEINITPLVDVVLVLLIIFMVIIPLTLRGYDVDIPGPPSAVSDPTQPPVEPIVLGIDLRGCPLSEPPTEAGLPAGCRVQINDERLAVADLPPRLAALFAGRVAADRVLFLTAEDGLNYEAVLRILDVAKSGVSDLRIGFVKAQT